MRTCFVLQCCVMGRMYEVESGTCPYGRHGHRCSGLVFFLNQEVETHKAPFRFAPILVLGSGLRDSRAWFATTKLVRNCIVCNGSLVRDNKGRPCTAQGTRRLSCPTRTRMHTQTNSHSQHQHALQHQHAPTRAHQRTLTPRRTPTRNHAPPNEH